MKEYTKEPRKPSEAAQESLPEDMIEGRNAVTEALRSGRTINKVFLADGDTDRALGRLAAMAKESGAVVVRVDRRKLNDMSPTGAHQGIMAAVAAHDYATVDDMLNAAQEKGEAPLLVICDELSDPHNLGAIIRTAECAGAHGVSIPRRRSVGLNARSILVLILAAAAAYLSLAPSFTQLPLPSVIDIVANPTLGIGALLLLQLLAMLIGVDIFSMGFSELLHGRPCRETLVSVAIIAAILHSVSLIVFPEQNGVTTPYIAATILLLYAMMREDRARYAARSRSYKAVAQADRPVAVYSHYDEVDDACRAAKGPLFNKNDFLTELERPDTVDRFSMIYAPLALALSIILALVSSLGRGEPVRFFWAFSAVTAVAAPIGLLCAFGAGYKNIARRLLASGAAIAGARQANLLRGTEEVVLAENDLFPTGSIELESIKAVGQMSEERILSFATSLTTAAGLELGRTLDAAARQHAIVPLSAQDVRAVEGGLTGHVGSSYVVLGTGALMVNMGITIPAEGDATTMYLLADNQLVGIIALRYMPTKNTYKAMRLMRRMHMNAVIAACDFNVSPAMVEEEFDLRRGFADQPDPAGVRRLLDPSYAKGDAPAAILTREGAGPFMQVLRCADKLAGAVRSALTLSTFAGLFGILIVFYLVFQNQAAALPVQHLLLYLLIWYIPVFIINQQAR